MSVGNLKTQGQKGTNWTWQYRMLLGLDKIAASIVTAGKDYEADLISIVCGSDPAIIRLEVRIFNTSTGAFTDIELYPPGSLTEDTTNYSACTKTYLEQGDATEATLLNILAKNTAIEVDTTAILAKNTEIEVTADAILAKNTEIELDVDRIKTNTGVQTNLASMQRVTSSVTVTDAVKSISFYNAHASATATIAIGGGSAVNLLAGETVNFDAGGNAHKFAGSHFVVNGTGADVLMIYVK